MLELLQIRNLAIINDLTLELRTGLNILTGETGAGKSVVMEALGLITGGRAQSDVIRTGEDRASLQAIFDVADDDTVIARLAQVGIDPPDDGKLFIRREILRAGKSRCQVNGQYIPVQALASLGEALVDIHGQHDHQALLRPDEHRRLLDAFAQGHDGALVRYIEAYEAHRHAAQALTDLQDLTHERTRRLDLLRFELEEINAAGVRPGEFEEIQDEARRLRNIEKLTSISAQAYALIYEGSGDADGLVGLMATTERLLADLARLDRETLPFLKPLEEARLALEEVAHNLRDYHSTLSAEPGRLEALYDRIDLLRKLLRKYGPTEIDILRVAEDHARALQEAAHTGERRAELEALEEQGRARLLEAATHLTACRQQAAAHLVQALEHELAELNMAGTRIEVRLTPLQSPLPGPNGAETVELMLGANAGEAPRPLRRVASGGELSRVMLALKAIDARLRQLPTMVFDEIDSGIGGVTADRVGQRIALMAARQQILCITHSPAIAALGGHHLHVSKSTRKGRTESHVRVLEGEERVAELARMIGGERAGAEGQLTARALLTPQAA